MISSVAVLLLAFLSLDWAKTCKAVNFNYKVYGGVKEYGHGCKKGCFGYFNRSSTDVVNREGEKPVDDHVEQDKCVECKTITASWYKESGYGWSTMSDDDAKEGAISHCNTQNCYWRKNGKCGAGSCLVFSQYARCDESYGHEWKDAKCKRVKGNKCKAYGYYGDVYKESWTGSQYDGIVADALCKDLKSYFRTPAGGPTNFIGSGAFTDDDAKKCQYRCEHPQWRYYAGGPWDYTRSDRKACHKLYGCMYSGGNPVCSALAIWAFVVILVFAILIFVAIIVVVVILILKLCGGKSTKVSPEAATAAESKSAAGPTAAPASQDPPPQTGPYVVIRLGKQSLETKKVESSVWGQSIVFTGLGAEDDDVVFELHDNSGVVLGTTDVRIPEYVNAKKRASITLKNGEVSIGVLEVDIEIQVQEEPEVKITGVFYVDRFSKA